MTSSSVYILWHSHTLNDRDDFKLIGVYTSEEKANSVKEKYKGLEGFQDYPDNFEVSKYELDKDNWSEGFFTVFE